MTVRTRRLTPSVAVGMTLVVGTLMAGGAPALADPSTIGGDGYVHVAPDGTVLGVDPYYPKDGNGGYDVADYAIALDYAPSWGSLRAKATITATATQDLSRFNLDLRGLAVHWVRVDGVAARFARAGVHELVITPATPLATGAEFTVEVGYGGTPRPISTPRGLTGWMSVSCDSVVAAGAPHGAMTWFPVNGTEVDKATLRVAVTVPTGWSVVGNGRQIGDVPVRGGHTVTWSEETPIAPHATTLGIGRWHSDTVTLPDGTTAVNSYSPCALHKRAVGDRLPEVMDFLTGVLWEYPQSAAGALFLDCSPGYTHPGQTRPVLGPASTVDDLVYATAYQWWGAGVSVKMWKDAPMVEGFARYAVWLWHEAKDGVDLDQRYRDTVARANPAFWSVRLADPGPGREFTPSTKAVLMVHALRRTIGDDAFFEIMAGFPMINPQGNQGWYDWELYVSAVTQLDLSGFNRAWLQSDQIPPNEHLYPGESR